MASCDEVGVCRLNNVIFYLAFFINQNMAGLIWVAMGLDTTIIINIGKNALTNVGFSGNSQLSFNRANSHYY
jgi:hypothetical protein